MGRTRDYVRQYFLNNISNTNGGNSETNVISRLGIKSYLQQASAII